MSTDVVKHMEINAAMNRTTWIAIWMLILIATIFSSQIRASSFVVGAGSLVDPTTADQWYCAQPQGCTASGTRDLWSTNYPHEINELAKALSNNVDLIYEYVRNNVEIVPMYGLQKGALGAIIDRSGTPFDQAQLMVELLRASGYTASYVTGTRTLTGTEVYNWLGVNNAVAVSQLLADGGIPGTVTPTSGTVTSVTVAHIWVRVVINGTSYDFDPSFKAHSIVAGVNIATASGWSDSTFLTAAQTGMTTGTQVGRLDSNPAVNVSIPYVANVNAGNVKSQLAARANQLTQYLRTNGYATREIDDVIGRVSITPSSGVVRQTSLASTSELRTWSGNIPDVYRTRVKLEMVHKTTAAVLLSQNVFADEVYGRRIAYYPYATGNGWLNDTTQLVIDGVNVGPVYSGPDTAVNQAGNRLRIARLTIDHPYAGNSGAYMDRVVSKTADFISPVVVVIGLGDVDDALQTKLNSEQIRDKLLPDTAYFRCPGNECETVEKPQQPAGETSLVRAYTGWLANQTRIARMGTRIKNSLYQQHDTLGIAYKRSFLTVTNPKGMCGNCWAVGEGAMVIDADTSISIGSKSANATDRRTVARALALVSHTLEAGEWEQDTSSATPASVGHRFGWAVANNPSSRFFLVKTGQNSVDLFPTGPNPYYYASIYPPVSSFTNAGAKVLVAENEFMAPGRDCGSPPCTTSSEALHLERGGAFQAFSADSVSVSNVITDAAGRSASGGSAGSPPVVDETYSPDKSKDLLKDQFKDRTHDFGVNLATGEFTYTAPEDVSVGAGEFPYKLSFQRTFVPGESHSPGMGPGWSHNLDMRVALSTNVREALGQNSTLAAASTLIALYATEVIYSSEPSTDATLLKRWVIAPFIQDWWASQTRFNVVSHTAGSTTKTFIKLSDGSFDPPNGYDPKDGRSLWKLTQIGTPTGYGVKWDYSSVSFTLTSPQHDVQSFAYWKRANRDYTQPYTYGPHTGWHITNWNFPSGVSVNFAYVPVDASTFVDDHLAYVSNSLGRQLNFSFAANSRWDNCNFQSVTNNVGGTATYNCSSASMSSPAGDVSRYTYGPITCFGNTDRSARPHCATYLTELFGPSDLFNPKIRLTYNKAGQVSTYADAVSVLNSSARLPFNFLIAGTRGERVDPLGKRVTVYYDSRKRAIQTLNELGYAQSAQYDGFGRVTKRTTAEGIVTDFGYDPFGNISSTKTTPKVTVPVTLPGSLTISATYDRDCGTIKTIQDAKQYVTTWFYDPSTCLLQRVEQPSVVNGKTGANAVPTTAYTYTPVGLVDTITDPSGVLVDYDYDANWNRTLVKTDPNGINQSKGFGYDPVGNITSVTTGRGNTTTYVYDNARRLGWIYGPAGTCAATQNVWVGGLVERVKNGRVCNPDSSIDSQWQIWLKRYTPTDKIDVEIDPDGGTVDTDYDAMDRVEYSTQSVGGGQPNRVTRTEYDAAGQVSKIYRAWGTADQITYAVYAYDKDGRVLTELDANQNQSSHLYDGYGRLARNTFADTSYESFKYDYNGNLVERRNRSGFVVSSAFDALNREISHSVPDNTTYAGSFARATTTTYDLASRKWDLTADGATLGQRYDTAGRLNRVIDQQLNALGASTGDVAYGYDASGNRQTVTFYAAQGAKTLTYTYDAAERLFQVKDGASVLAQYDYDPLARIKAVAYQDGSSVAWAFESDDDLQSITHSYAGGSVAFGYTHNQAHQIQGLNVNDSNYLMMQKPTVAIYTPNNLNQYTQIGGKGLSYDPNGNLLSDGSWTFSYDEENRLRKASASGVVADYIYDALGRRKSKNVNGVVTYFINDGVNELAELTSSGTRLRFYVNALQMDEHLAAYDDAGGAGYTFFHRNHQNSVIFTTRSGLAGTQTQYRYDAYGQEYASDPTTGNPFRYNGRYLDAETGLYYYRARYYSPGLGRFLQIDPVGTKDDANLYAYVGNDPANHTDPSGQIIDTVLDAAFIASDIAAIAEEGFTAANVAGLAGDLVGAAIPGISGVGKLAKAGISRLSKAERLERNVETGKKAEKLVADKLGDSVAGKQVTFKTSDGTRARADIVTNDKGVVEVKANGAKLSEGQEKLFNDVQAGREVTPVGKNAAEAGLTPGQPTKMKSCSLARVSICN